MYLSVKKPELTCPSGLKYLLLTLPILSHKPSQLRHRHFTEIPCWLLQAPPHLLPSLSQGSSPADSPVIPLEWDLAGLPKVTHNTEEDHPGLSFPTGETASRGRPLSLWQCPRLSGCGCSSHSLSGIHLGVCSSKGASESPCFLGSFNAVLSMNSSCWLFFL